MIIENIPKTWFQIFSGKINIFWTKINPKIEFNFNSFFLARVDLDFRKVFVIETSCAILYFRFYTCIGRPGRGWQGRSFYMHVKTNFMIRLVRIIDYLYFTCLDFFKMTDNNKLITISDACDLRFNVQITPLNRIIRMCDICSIICKQTNLSFRLSLEYDRDVFRFFSQGQVGLVGRVRPRTSSPFN